MPLRSMPGTFIGNPSTHEAIYTPPDDVGTIRSLLSNWERFVHESADVDPLIVMAVAHYQFEAIHPFEDGNGRTGRVLNVLVLVAAGLISQPILYLSRYLIENKGTYYRLLQGVTTDQDWQSWILYMLEGIRQTANFTLRKIAAIRALQSEFHDRLRDVQGTVNADLLQTLFEQPYSRIANVMARCGVSRPTATGWLNTLADAGLLAKIKAGRELLYVNVPFMQVLTRDEPIDERGVPTLF